MEVGIILIIVFVVFGLGLTALWVWSLIHCIINKNLSDTNRIIGIVLIVALGLIGSFVYLFLPTESSDNRDRMR